MREFPGCPVVKTPGFQALTAKGLGSVPGWWIKIMQVAQNRQKKKKRKKEKKHHTYTQFFLPLALVSSLDAIELIHVLVLESQFEFPPHLGSFELLIYSPRGYGKHYYDLRVKVVHKMFSEKDGSLLLPPTLLNPPLLSTHPTCLL